MVKLPAHCYAIFLCPLDVGPNLTVFVPKILICMGESKIFGTHTTKKTPRHIVCIGSHEPKMPIFGQKCQFWTKFGRFWAKKSIFSEGGWSKTFDSLISGKQWDTFFLCWKHWPVRFLLAAGDENVQFWPENLDIWGQKSIFCFGIAIFVKRVHHQYTLDYSFPIRTTLTKISVSKLWVIFWGSPRFLAISGHSHFRSIMYKYP